MIVIICVCLYNTQKLVNLNTKYTKEKWNKFYKNYKNWKINDITLFIKQKLKNENNQQQQEEEKFDYEKFENTLKQANIEKHSVKYINKPLQ